MLEEEYKYYIDNKDSLIKKHNKKFVVIKENEVIGVYSTREKALEETIKEHELGSFLIQKVSKNEEEQIQRFSSRVFV